jgi:hypothetical protein
MPGEKGQRRYGGERIGPGKSRRKKRTAVFLQIRQAVPVRNKDGKEKAGFLPIPGRTFFGSFHIQPVMIHLKDHEI